MFYMSTMEAYIGGRKIDPLENVELTSSSTASFLVEGIAQNTTVGIFEPEVNLSVLLELL